MAARSKEFNSVSKMVRDLSDDLDVVKDIEDAMRRKRIISRLMAIRAARGLCQTEIADRLGVSQGSVSKLESSEDADVRLGTLQKYAEAVGCELLTGVRPEDIEPAEEVKYLAYAVNERLSRMAELAQSNPHIADGVSRFFIEALVNFSVIVGKAAERLPRRSDGTLPFRINFDVNFVGQREGDEHEDRGFLDFPRVSSPDCGTAHQALS